MIPRVCYKADHFRNILARFQEKCVRFSARKARQNKTLEHIQRLEDP